MTAYRSRAALLLAMVVALLALPVSAAPRPDARAVLDGWYALVLELVRHTPTYSPPVASRAFGYLGVIAFEATAAGAPEAVSLAGQLNGLTPPPARGPGRHDEAVLLDAALSAAARALFWNTGPTGQRAIALTERRLAAAVAAGLPPEVVARSAAAGAAVAAHVLAWAEDDGGAAIENMGFPPTYTPAAAPGRWVPTSTIGQQQAPLLPAWGRNRPFVLPSGATCHLPPPPAYSEAEGSPFRAEAEEVLAVSRALTDEQRMIARFWSDDPMLSPTPPGHWIVIARRVLDDDDADLLRRTDVLARLGIALADAFIACWHSKYAYDLVRPVTYIRKLMDPAWDPFMITPPFPEYPSGHSTQSGAAAEVLTALFGADHAFRDATHEADGLPARDFPSFRAAAEEAALSRLYGGIHFRSAIERGLDQGACVGARVNALVTRR